MAKKIWIDLDNSPHVPFFTPIIEELEQRGYRVLLTAGMLFRSVNWLTRLVCNIVASGIILARTSWRRRPGWRCAPRNSSRSFCGINLICG